MLIAQWILPRVVIGCAACRLIGGREVDVVNVWSASHRRRLGRMPDRYAGQAQVQGVKLVVNDQQYDRATVEAGGCWSMPISW
jgi:hypothetical protein